MTKPLSTILVGATLFAVANTRGVSAQEAAKSSQTRSAASDDDLKFWLNNMLHHHRYSLAEASDVTGLSKAKVQAAIKRLGIDTEPAKASDRQTLLVLPYPGGRHPRIGFLDGAVDPQRETKISVFTPWDPHSYVVADIPEAIWSNLGLTYLAHTHVPTVWTKQGVTLKQLEWTRHKDGSLDFKRTLPNGIAFGTKVVPRKDSVRMEMWLTNGTKEELTDLRVQNCVMLKAAKGFAEQTNENKVLSSPYTACRSKSGDRWVITAWEPCHRPWANERCPCLHSDPKFPDCPPGETKRLKGWLSFYKGKDIRQEFERIEKTGWREK